MKDNIFYKHFIIDNTKNNKIITPGLFLEYVFQAYFNVEDVASIMSKGGTVQYVLSKNDIYLYVSLDAEGIFVVQTEDFEYNFEFNIFDKNSKENKNTYKEFFDFFKKYNLNN